MKPHLTKGDGAAGSIYFRRAYSQQSGGLLTPHLHYFFCLPKKKTVIQWITEKEKGTRGACVLKYSVSRMPLWTPQVQFAHWEENGCFCQGAAARG